LTPAISPVLVIGDVVKGVRAKIAPVHKSNIFNIRQFSPTTHLGTLQALFIDGHTPYVGIAVLY